MGTLHSWIVPQPSCHLRLSHDCSWQLVRALTMSRTIPVMAELDLNRSPATGPVLVRLWLLAAFGVAHGCQADPYHDYHCSKFDRAQRIGRAL